MCPVCLNFNVMPSSPFSKCDFQIIVPLPKPSLFEPFTQNETFRWLSQSTTMLTIAHENRNVAGNRSDIEKTKPRNLFNRNDSVY